MEDSRVDLDLFNAGAVELFERRYDAGFLACARGTVDEKMGEVSGLCLGGRGVSWGVGEWKGRLTRERKRSDKSSW